MFDQPIAFSSALSLDAFLFRATVASYRLVLAMRPRATR
jgi:hypothetical protein